MKLALLVWIVSSLAVAADDTARLTQEVRALGWIVFSARSEHGDWDLFCMRPDGSERRNLTETPDWNEAAPQFSRDGRRLLYRRLPRPEAIDGNRYGEQGALVMANRNGTNPKVLSAQGKLPWASWSPDSSQFTILELKGISFVDASTGAIIRTMPRRGFFQQLTWSPDGA